MIDSRREIGDAVQREIRLSVTSLTLPAAGFSAIARSHWNIDNGLHRVTHMLFRDDGCRVRTDHAPYPTSPPHAHRAHLARKAAKDAFRLKRKTAA